MRNRWKKNENTNDSCSSYGTAYGDGVKISTDTTTRRRQLVMRSSCLYVGRRKKRSTSSELLISHDNDNDNFTDASMSFECVQDDVRHCYK